MIINFKEKLLTGILYSLMFPASYSFAQDPISLREGEIETYDDVSIVIEQSNQVAVKANGYNSSAILNNSSISISGQNDIALYTLNNGNINFSNGDITSTTGQAIYAKSGGTINLDTVAVTKEGGDSDMIVSDGSGSKITGNSITITDKSNSSFSSVISAMNSSQINLSDIEIDSTSSSSLYAQSSTLSVDNLKLNQTSDNPQNVIMALGKSSKNAVVNISNSNISGNGKGSSGLLINSNIFSETNINNSTLTANGDTYVGIWVSGVTGTLNADNMSLSTNGKSANAVEDYGYMNLSNSDITTYGEQSYALYSQYQLNSDNLDLTTFGDNSPTAVAARGGTLTLDNNRIKTQGVNSAGIFNMASSKITADNTTIETTGDSSSALRVSYGSTTKISNSQFSTQGADAYGIFSAGSITSDQASTVAITNSIFNAENSSALSVVGSNMDVYLQDSSKLIGGNGVLLEAYTGISNGTTLLSTVNLSVSGDSYLQGDVITQRDDYGNNTTNIELADGSAWLGGSDWVDSVTVDESSQWDITHTSAVDQLALSGTLNFRFNNNQYSTLNVAGNMTGGGTLILNTHLGDDSSSSDVIHVTGNMEGNYNLTVNNTDGTGALTTGDGIDIIQVDGKTEGVVKLVNRVAIGSYEYLLYHGSSTDTNDWYLRSSYTPDPTPDIDPTDDTDTTPDTDPTDDTGTVPDTNTTPDTDPTDDSTSTPDNSPIAWRQEVAGYIAAPALNQRYGFDSIGTYHQRTGSGVSHNRNTWGRISASHQQNDPNRFSYSTDTWFAQLGIDLYENKNDEQTEHTAGVMVTLGNQKTDAQDSARGVNPLLSVNTGSVNTDIYSFGGYYTVMGKNGGYIDAVSMASYYRNHYESASDAQQHGYGIVGSVEVGKPYTLYNPFKIEYQAQVKYQYLNLDSFHDDISSISGVSQSAVEARGGIRLLKEDPVFTPYITLDAVTSTGTHPDVTIADKSLSSQMSEDHWQVGSGISYKFENKSELYAEGQYQKSFNNTFEGYSGIVGVKVNF